MTRRDAPEPHMTTFSRTFLADSIKILDQLDDTQIEDMVEQVRLTRERGGRIFFCGSGGGAGHASHAACDFRKLTRIESYAVTDNVSELTARINDDGWDSSYVEWLKMSHLSARDCLFVFSVGGGSLDRSISVNLVRAMELAQSVGASIVGVVGRDGGELRARADACVLIPTVDDQFVTPQTEGLQALVWHLVVSHPALGTRDRQVGVGRRAGARHHYVIITRTPLRITLGGGGTDLPSYYREHGGGFLVAAAITKYVFIAVNRNFDGDLLLKYSKVERVAAPDRRAAPSAPGDPARDERRCRSRDLVHGRHPCRHRPRLVGCVHRGSAPGIARAQARAPFEPGVRPARVPHRDRPARRADRQAGPVHRRGRRHHRVLVRPR